MKTITLLQVATLIAAFSCPFVSAEVPRSTGHRVIPPEDLKEVPQGEQGPAKAPRIAPDNDAGMLVEENRDKLKPNEALPDPHEEQKQKAVVVHAKGGPVTAALNASFSTDLYAQLRAKKGNVFFSPYSISEAMGMAYMGAKGDTAAEFVKAMGFGQDQAAFGSRMQVLRRQLAQKANQGEDKLNIANALCVTGEVPLQSYQDLVRQKFGGELFAGGLEEINGWVSKKTEGNIEKILESLDPNSACVILNAVYFKGTWAKPFDTNGTYEDAFHVTPKKKVDVKMMSQRDDFAVTRNEKYIAVELPYQTSASMVLILPAKAGGMAALEAGLDEAFAAKVCDELKDKQQLIELMVPKFKIATEYDLATPMEGLGLVKAFDPEQADFNAMYDTTKLKTGNNIYISQIKHKATLAVDELGSVASAATSIGLTARSIPDPVPSVEFNRPFLVLIRENTTNSTLFMGRISDPTK